MGRFYLPSMQRVRCIVQSLSLQWKVMFGVVALAIVIRLVGIKVLGLIVMVVLMLLVLSAGIMHYENKEHEHD